MTFFFCLFNFSNFNAKVGLNINFDVGPTAISRLPAEHKNFHNNSSTGFVQTFSRICSFYLPYFRPTSLLKLTRVQIHHASRNQLGFCQSNLNKFWNNKGLILTISKFINNTTHPHNICHHHHQVEKCAGHNL